MSAYMVTRDHIAYLLDACSDPAITCDDEFGYVLGSGNWHSVTAGGPSELSRLGQMLWDENRRSIEHRYPDTKADFSRAPGAEAGETFVYGEHRSGAWSCMDPEQVIQACQCFRYQSCEHKGWSTSDAAAFVESLIQRAVVAILERWREHSGKRLYWGAPPRGPS